MSNGKVANGESHLSNGGHSRSTLNGEGSGEALSNGHHAGEEPSGESRDLLVQ